MITRFFAHTVEHFKEKSSVARSKGLASNMIQVQERINLVQSRIENNLQNSVQ